MSEETTVAAGNEETGANPASGAPATDYAAKYSGLQSQLAKSGWTNPKVIPTAEQWAQTQQALAALPQLQQSLQELQATSQKTASELVQAREQAAQAEHFRNVHKTLSDPANAHLLPLAEEIAQLSQPGKEAETIAVFNQKLSALRGSSGSRPGGLPTPSSAPPAGGSVDLDQAVADAEDAWFNAKSPTEAEQNRKLYFDLLQKQQRAKGDSDPWAYKPTPDGF